MNRITYASIVASVKATLSNERASFIDDILKIGCETTGTCIMQIEIFLNKHEDNQCYDDIEIHNIKCMLDDAVDKYLSFMLLDAVIDNNSIKFENILALGINPNLNMLRYMFTCIAKNKNVKMFSALFAYFPEINECVDGIFNAHSINIHFRDMIIYLLNRLDSNGATQCRIAIKDNIDYLRLNQPDFYAFHLARLDHIRSL